MGVSKTMDFDWSQVDTITDLMEPFSWHRIGDGFVAVEDEAAGGVLFPVIKGGNGAGIEGKRANGCGGFWRAYSGAAMKVYADSLADGDAAVVEVGPF